MVRRLVSVVVVGLLAASTLSACSPPPAQQLALRLVDGRVVAVLAPCSGDRVTDIIVKEESGGARMWHISGGGEEPAPDSVTLFEPVTGWHVAKESLTELEPDVEYHASASAGHGRNSDVDHITLAALTALGDDQVLGPGEGRQAAAMSMAELRAKAAKVCD